jgi:molybdate transport system substrate-binding protein
MPKPWSPLLRLWNRLHRLPLLLALALLPVMGHAQAQPIQLTVSAAASLTNAFNEIAAAFTAQNPDVRVALNVGASGALLQQIDRGAPVDVFASADEFTMDLAQQRGLIVPAQRHNFTRNLLVLAVPADSRLVLASLSDLRQEAVRRVAIGNPASVPVGRYTQSALEAAGLWPAVSAKAIYTLNVRQSLNYVSRGEVEAAFVYATDAALMPERVRVAFQVPTPTPIVYPIAPVARSNQPAAAQRFVAFVLSAPAQAILQRHGFLPP